MLATAADVVVVVVTERTENQPLSIYTKTVQKTAPRRLCHQSAHTHTHTHTFARKHVVAETRKEKKKIHSWLMSAR